MSEWKCDFGFRLISFWYGNFPTREALEKYVRDSFLAQVGIPDTRTARHYSDIVFLKRGTVSDLVADQRGSSFFAPLMEEAVAEQNRGDFNAGYLLTRFVPKGKDLDRKYHTRKLKHLGYFKTHSSAKSLSDKRGGAAKHKNHASVWLCDFKTERSLKAYFQWPHFERFYSSKFAKENQPGFQFEEELSELTSTRENNTIPIEQLLEDHTLYSTVEKENIVALCKKAGFAEAKAIYVALHYNHEQTVEFSPATKRIENPNCQFIGSFQARGRGAKEPARSAGKKKSSAPTQSRSKKRSPSKKGRTTGKNGQTKGIETRRTKKKK